METGLPIMRHDSASAAFVSVVQERLASASQPLAKFLASRGWSIVAHGSTERGGRGSVPIEGPKNIYVFEGHIDRLMGDKRSDVITTDELNHEMGHALDRALAAPGYKRRSAMPDFVAAHALDVSRMDEEAKSALNYYVRVEKYSNPEEHGRMEACAQIVQLLNTKQEVAPLSLSDVWSLRADWSVLDSFPSVVALVRKEMQDHGLLPKTTPALRAGVLKRSIENTVRP